MDSADRLFENLETRERQKKTARRYSTEKQRLLQSASSDVGHCSPLRSNKSLSLSPRCPDSYLGVCSSPVQPLHPRVDDVSCDAGKTEATALRMRQVQRRRGFRPDRREYADDSAVRVSNIM